MNQKTLLSIAGLAVVATVTGASLIAATLLGPKSESATDCLKRIEMQLLPAAEEVRLCGGTFKDLVADTKKPGWNVPKAPVAKVPVVAPVEAPVVAPVEATYTYEGAMAEACEAGRQYSNDVAEGFMTHSQSYAEARSYAHHLSAQSAGVDNGVLYAKIKECMW
jgi:hypothetical protein